MKMSKAGRYPILRRAARARELCRAAAVLIAVHLLAGVASAQPSPGIYKPGDAAVTGFSGAVRPFEIEPGQDPDLRTFIDPDGPSLRIVDLRRMGGPPEAQLVGAPKPFTVNARWIGQVFGVALDDRAPANVYVAATSAYGLSIVAAGPDGQPQRVRLGGNGVRFMPAQWGQDGGPGSIWKIDGVTGAVGLFANVATGGRPNSGAALGALSYDPATKSLFVSDRETGLIHRFGANGADLGVFDHGVAGNTAIGGTPVEMAAAAGVDLASPQFDSARPETWGYAAPARRVFGLAVRDRRLYYAVAEGLTIWSVGLAADGSFGTDARLELAVPPSAGPTEISKITFDEQGRMYLAERPAPTGAQDLETLSLPSIGRVLRYTKIGVTERGQPIWQPTPDDYAIGFPETFRNGNGGVAIGYDYDFGGVINPASCGGFLWTTGERLRQPTDAKLAAQLGDRDALAINGMQGNAVWRIRRDEKPPRFVYFIDYADAPPDAMARGHMGDVAILRGCSDAAMLLPSSPPAGAPPMRPNIRICATHVCGPDGTVCPVNQFWDLKTKSCGASCAPPDVLVNGQCCSPKDLQPGGACKSPPSTKIGKPMCGDTQTAIGPNKECCENAQIYSGPKGEQLCCATSLVNGVCDPLKPKIPEWACPGCCAPGYVKSAGKCCLKSHVTSKGHCCPPGQIASSDGALCVPLHWLPKLSQCCASGFVPTAKGKCCAAANLTTSGECCSTAVNPNDRKQCPTQTSPPESCARGEVRDSKGACVSEGRPSTGVPGKPIRPKCRPNERRDASGACVVRKSRMTPDTPPPAIGRPIVCPPGFVPGPLGQRCFPAGRGRIMRPPMLGGERVMRPPGGAGFPGRRW
jgi:hypothetical protein